VFLLQQQPIIVRVVEQPVRETSLADIIFAALGLVGVLLLAAALLGLVLGGILILVKRLRARSARTTDAEALRVTPTS
jgi:uncharacterized membrane protein YqhA